MESLNTLMTSQKFGLKDTPQANGTAGANPEAAYIHNMELSQGRTRSVLEYVLQEIPSIKQNQDDSGTG